MTNSSNHEASLINVNDTGRRGKQLQIDRIVLPFSGREVKRHVIKIPPNVSKVKLIGTAPPPQGPPKKIHQMKKFPFSDVPLSQKLSSTNSQAFEEYDYEEDESLSPSNVKRTFVSNGANDEFEDEFPGSESIELDHYYTNAQPIKQKKNRTSKRPIKHIRKVSKQVKDDSFFPTYARPERFTQKHENFYGAFKNRYKTGIPDSQDYNYEPHETTVYFKKVQPSNGYGMKPFPPNILNQHQEKPILGNYYEANHMISPSNVKKRVSKPRKPLLNPQYTTHNPHVATNFGLSAYSTSNNHDYLSNGHFVGSTLGYGMTIPAPTESVISAVPVLPSKIKVIQPPQLG